MIQAEEWKKKNVYTKEQIGINWYFRGSRIANADVQVLSPFEVDMGNVLAKGCLFTHLADTEQLLY